MICTCEVYVVMKTPIESHMCVRGKEKKKIGNMFKLRFVEPRKIIQRRKIGASGLETNRVSYATCLLERIRFHPYLNWSWTCRCYGNPSLCIRDQFALYLPRCRILYIPLYPATRKAVLRLIQSFLY